MNIENLIMVYERSLKDIEEWNKLFNITDENRDIVLNKYEGDYLKKPKLREVFEEICYTTQLTDEQVKNYFLILEKRIDDIRIVIDQHFEFIKQSILDDKSKKTEQSWNSL